MTFDIINGIDIVGVDDSRRNKATQELGQEVDGETFPRQAPKEAEIESDGRIEEAAGVASDVDAQHNAQAPAVDCFCQQASNLEIFNSTLWSLVVMRKKNVTGSPPGDGLILPAPISARTGLVASTQEDLGHASITKHDHDEGPKEFCERLSQGKTDATPQQAMMLKRLMVLGDRRLRLKTKIIPHRIEGITTVPTPSLNGALLRASFGYFGLWCLQSRIMRVDNTRLGRHDPLDWKRHKSGTIMAGQCMWGKADR